MLQIYGKTPQLPSRDVLCPFNGDMSQYITCLESIAISFDSGRSLKPLLIGQIVKIHLG